MHRPLNADFNRQYSARPWLLAIVLAFAAPLGVADDTTTDAQNDQTSSEAEDTSTSVDLVPLKASYSASIDRGISINGTAVRSLEQQEDGSWIYRFDVDSFLADIRESLTFRWEDGQVIPQRYRYTLEGFAIRNRSRAIDFNWPSEAINGSYDGDRFTIDTEPGALDPLGFQLQMSQDLKAGKTEMSYAVVDKRGYDYDKFAVIGEEVVDSKVGSVDTIKVEKVRGEGSKRETLMWFAPELDYLLIRLVQTEPDGTQYEVNIESADIKDS